MATRAVDPILLEVIRNRLETIADEMELTLLKSAASPIVKEGLDASAALFNVRGETIAQAAAIPIHLGCLELAARRIVRGLPAGDDGGGGRVPPERPVRRRHAPARHHARGPGAGRRARRRAGVHDVPPPGRRRPHAGQRADGRHGALPGGAHHPADPVVPRGRARREPVRPPPPQRAHPGRVHRGPHGPGGRGPPRRDPPQRAVRPLRNRDRARLRRRAARARGDPDAPRNRGHSRRDLRLRRLARQRRDRRPPGPDPGGGDRARLDDDLRLHGHEPPGPRPVQLGARFDTLRGLLRRARHLGPDRSEQRRLLPGGRHGAAAREPRQSAAAGPGQLPHGHHQADRRHHPGRSRQGPPRSACRRPAPARSS